MDFFVDMLFDAAFIIAAAWGYRIWLLHDIARHPRKYAEETHLCFMCHECPQECPVVHTCARHPYVEKGDSING